MRDLKGMLKAKLGMRPSMPPSVYSHESASGLRTELKAHNTVTLNSGVSASPPSTRQGRQHHGDTESLRYGESVFDAKSSVSTRSGVLEAETFVSGEGGAPGHSNALLREAGHGETQATFPDRTSSRNVSAATQRPTTATNDHNKTGQQPQPQTSPAQPRESNELHSSTRTAATTALTNANLQQSNNFEKLQTQSQNTHASEADNESEAGTKGGDGDFTTATVLTPTSSNKQRPAELVRRQSLLPPQQAQHIIHSLLDGDTADGNSAQPIERAPNINIRQTDAIRPRSAISSYIDAGMPTTRKIWVKRPGSSATLVQIREDDLVDDVRDMILRKYANSLGRSFDAPDVTLKIIPREHRQERLLGPEEPMARTLDAVFPGGQTVHEALIIDVPVKRTPRPSPRAMYYHPDEIRPSETGDDYFPPMPVALVPSPHHNTNGSSAPPSAVHSMHAPSSMSVVSSGYVPALPSPGGRQYRTSRPRVARVPTSSPSVGHGAPTPTSVIQGTPLEQSFPPQLSRSRTHTVAVEHSSGSTPPLAPPLPTPPPGEETTTSALGLQGMQPVHGLQPVHMPPLAEISTPSSIPGPKPRKAKKLFSRPSMPTGMLNGAAVPPINVLIVEDNIINLKLLEAFMKRLKVRWQTAMNGKEAMTKWRSGGFHLVLMDIQLPVMNGLEATREIRRLEKANGIGVFSSSASSKAPELKRGEGEGELKEEDRLGGKEGDGWGTSGFFKSPVIIVALTASSLQSDRHEALAAGCNDFLTKVSHLLFYVINMYANLIRSLSTLSGWSAKSWNGAACKLSSTSMVGGSGKTSLQTKARQKPRKSRGRRRA